MLHCEGQNPKDVLFKVQKLFTKPTPVCQSETFSDYQLISFSSYGIPELCELKTIYHVSLIGCSLELNLVCQKYVLMSITGKVSELHLENCVKIPLC